MRPSSTTPLYLWIALTILNAAQSLYFKPLMPPVMAQHFVRSGAPNGWTTPGSFYQLSWVLILLLGAVFFLLPKLLYRLPVSVINIPHRSYWLAPDHRARALAMMEEQMNWMGVAVAVLQLAAMYLVERANLNPQRQLDTVAFHVIFIGFIVYMIGWFVVF